MKTFEEALITALKVGSIEQPPLPEDQERVMRLQHEYMEEVYTHPVLHGAAMAWLQATAHMASQRDDLPVDWVILNAFKNGVSLGVTIGIQMERPELLELAQEQKRDQSQTTGEVVGRVVRRPGIIRRVCARVRAGWREAVRGGSQD